MAEEENKYTVELDTAIAQLEADGDPFGFANSLKEANESDKALKAKCEEWTTAANQKFSGKWIYNSKWGHFYRVKEVISCHYPFYDGEDAYRYHRYIPPKVKKNMAYQVHVTASLDVKQMCASYEDGEVSIMLSDGNWNTVDKKQVLADALELSTLIQESIAKMIAANNNVLKIVASVTEPLPIKPKDIPNEKYVIAENG